MLLHSGKKPHKCDRCDKRFALKVYKTTHEKSCYKKHILMTALVEHSDGYDNVTPQSSYLVDPLDETSEQMFIPN